MTTPTRRRHLEWIRDREPVSVFDASGPGPSLQFVKRLEKEGDVERCGTESGRFGFTKFRLTEQGRQKIGPEPEVSHDIGLDAVDHLKTMYPTALDAVPKSAATSLRNFINARVTALLARQKGQAK